MVLADIEILNIQSKLTVLRTPDAPKSSWGWPGPHWWPRPRMSAKKRQKRKNRKTLNRRFPLENSSDFDDS